MHQLVRSVLYIIIVLVLFFVIVFVFIIMIIFIIITSTITSIVIHCSIFYLPVLVITTFRC